METVGEARNSKTKSKMAESRFASSDEIAVDELKSNAKKKNTTKSTQTWLIVWKKWANERKFNPKLEEYEHEDLDKKLQMFYAEVRTTDGLEYEPESLKSILRAANVERQSTRMAGHPNEKSLNDYDEGSERVHQDQRNSTDNNIKQFLRISSVVFPTSLYETNPASKQPSCFHRKQFPQLLSHV